MSTADHITEPGRLLLIWQDPLLRDDPSGKSDFIPLGRSYTPGSQPFGCGGVRSFLRIATRLIGRKYDAIILPAVHLDWAHDPPGGMKYRLRKLISAAIKEGKIIPRIVRKLRGEAVILILDRRDGMMVASHFAEAVGADLYLKTNLSEGAEVPCEAEVLPYAIDERFYPDTAAPKGIDLFYSAAPNSAARQKAEQELEALRGAGVTIFSPQERIPFETFVRTLGQSLLTLSPEGFGYHGFRHYEAMMMKSVPVINRPPSDLKTSLRSGENCLFYDPDVPGDLKRTVLKALEDRTALTSWGAELRRHALEHHTFAAIARLLRQRIAWGRAIQGNQ